MDNTQNTQKATITGFMPGDILFYSTLTGDMPDYLIANWTNSPFVHVAIATSAVLKIEAAFSGIIQTPIDIRSVAASWSYTDNARPLDPIDFAKAMVWLESMKGQQYGWGDVANSIFDKFIHGTSIVVGEHFDCSGLATEFLIMAGGAFNTSVNPHETTPAKLAAYLGVTKGTHT